MVWVAVEHIITLFPLGFLPMMLGILHQQNIRHDYFNHLPAETCFRILFVFTLYWNSSVAFTEYSLRFDTFVFIVFAFVVFFTVLVVLQCID